MYTMPLGPNARVLHDGRQGGEDPGAPGALPRDRQVTGCRG